MLKGVDGLDERGKVGGGEEVIQPKKNVIDVKWETGVDGPEFRESKGKVSDTQVC